MLHFDVAKGQSEVKEQEITRPLFMHRAESGDSATFGIESELAGTQETFRTWQPLSLDVLDQGQTIVIDELETSLHPLLVDTSLILYLCL